MEQFLNVQDDVIRAYLDSSEQSENHADRAGDELPPTRTSNVSRRSGPWLDEIEIVEEGSELFATRRLTIAGDPVAENHTLGGRRVSVLDLSRKVYRSFHLPSWPK